jgi:hypothetical protein
MAILSINYLYVTKDDKGNITEITSKSVLLTKIVVIGAESPEPPDPPLPPNPPNPPVTPTTPVFPASKYNLSQSSYDAANSIQSPNKTKVAQALANSFQGVAGQVAAGTLKGKTSGNVYDPTVILLAVQKSNQAAMATTGDAIATWNSMFTTIQTNLYNLYSAKNLYSDADFAEALNEIANGIGAVR